VTFDVGGGNPGATALRFYSNNSGAVRNCRFLAASGSGAVGLDLAHRDMNGPLLVKDCEVTGFRTGIACGHAVNSQTFEHLRLQGQTEWGFDNAGQNLSIRGLASSNTVPALRTYGAVCLIDADLEGVNAAKVPAVVNYNGGRILVRNVRTRGYARALGDVTTPDFTAAFRMGADAKPGSAGPEITEYSSHPATSVFASRNQSLGLTIRETPAPDWEPTERWAVVDNYGADPSGQQDSSEAIQRALDSGAATIFLPGSYRLTRTLTIGPKVRHLLGLGGCLDYNSEVKPDLRLVGDSPTSFTMEHFAGVHGGLELKTRRTVVLRSVSDCRILCAGDMRPGELFLEDVVSDSLEFRGQKVWARQLNVENQGTHLVNQGGDLWILGYKTERGGTLLETTAGGRSEVLGNFSYTTTAGELAPMFVTVDSKVFAFFSETCFNGNPYQTLVRETRQGVTQEMKRGQGSTSPYVSNPADR
jgi:hypothetical protein